MTLPTPKNGADGLRNIAREKALERYTLRGEQSSAIAAYYRAVGEEMEQQDLE